MSKNVIIYNYLFSQKRHFAATLKENKNFFAKKIRGLVNSEFVKRCHKHVIKPKGGNYYCYLFEPRTLLFSPIQTA